MSSEKITSKDLVKLVDESTVVQFEKQDKLKAFLSNQPPVAWVKKHPFASNVDYLPIDKVELLLDTIFQEWRVEILSITQLAQSICCTVRLHYLNPITKEWSYHDGVGAVPLKTDKGFTAADLAHIKNDAVATGAPAAKSFAIKDAAEHLGDIFGRNLNRKDTVGFAGVYTDFEAKHQQAVQEAIEKLEQAKDFDELKQIFLGLSHNVQLDKEVAAKKDELKAKLSKSEGKKK